MSSPISDRRVRRTRVLLHRALFELIMEQGYDNTTVQDILDRADVGRSTFYNHYPTKDELLLSGVDDLCAAIHDSTEAPADDDHQSLLGPLRPVFVHVESHEPLFHAMLGDRASSLAHRTGRRILAETIAIHLRDRLAGDDQVQFDLTVAYLVDSVIGVIFWWRQNHPELPAEQVFRRFESLASRGLEAHLAAR